MGANRRRLAGGTTKLAGLALVALLALTLSAFFEWGAAPRLAQAVSPVAVLNTTEGTRIEMYTTQITAQAVYDLFKRNGLNAEVGQTLGLVQVWDDGGTTSALGFSFVDGAWVPTASMRLTAANLGMYPNFSLGHEFGHVFAHHYLWRVWSGSWDSYLRARGLYGDSRLDSSYEWRQTEIFAEDYRQLLASPEAWQEAPSQLNKQIPLASEVSGLQAFLCTSFQGKTSNGWFRCSGAPGSTPTPTPTPRPATATPTATRTPTRTPTPAATATPVRTPTPVPTGTPVVVSTPTATPTPVPEHDSATVTVGPGWRTFTAPITGTTSAAVYLQKGKSPTWSVIGGKTYWAKGPLTVIITP